MGQQKLNLNINLGEIQYLGDFDIIMSEKKVWALQRNYD